MRRRICGVYVRDAVRAERCTAGRPSQAEIFHGYIRLILFLTLFGVIYRIVLFFSSRGFITFVPELQIFDLVAKDVITLSVVNLNITGAILNGATPLDVITQITEFTGRMTPHPDWIMRGAVLGIEGGMPFVKEKTEVSLYWRIGGTRPKIPT